MPEPTAPRAPTVKMTKTQPLMAAPEPKVYTAPVKVTAASADAVEKTSLTDIFNMLDTIPRPVCWIIFGISAVTLLIQIWNYLSS
ncbi:MAG: hypothetical protein M3128_07520 [Verrucomicrobiota bacterium]|nr:hypothetical protein [Verrucomicrobiota bacterium]